MLLALLRMTLLGEIIIPCEDIPEPKLSSPHVEIRKEKELLDQQPTSQQETALLKIISFSFVLF